MLLWICGPRKQQPATESSAGDIAEAEDEPLASSDHVCVATASAPVMLVTNRGHVGYLFRRSSAPDAARGAEAGCPPPRWSSHGCRASGGSRLRRLPQSGSSPFAPLPPRTAPARWKPQKTRLDVSIPASARRQGGRTRDAGASADTPRALTRNRRALRVIGTLPAPARTRQALSCQP